MALVYVDKLKGYIGDTANIDFIRCDDTAYSYYECQSTNFTDTLNFMTITGGWGTSPLAYIPTDRTTEFTFESSQFSLDLFSMANAVQIDEGDYGVLETSICEVKNGPKVELPFEVKSSSVHIRGLTEVASSPAAGKFSVAVTKYSGPGTFTSGGTYTVTIGGTVAEGDVLTCAGNTITLDATSGASANAAAAALKALLDADTTVTEKYTLSVNNAVITFVEKSGYYGTGEPDIGIVSTSGTMAVAITVAPQTSGSGTEVPAKTVITLNASDVNIGDNIAVTYWRRAVQTMGLDVLSTSSTAKGALAMHFPVYSSGVDCTDASVKGWVHIMVPRVRVTALPTISGSYKSASTMGLTFAAIDMKRGDKLYYRIAYEPADANGDIQTATNVTDGNVKWMFANNVT